MKQEQIIEAAIRRFSHFGIQKTNLAEIAEDLSISKPALFYYFPDKDALVVAVEAKIITEYIGALEVAFDSAGSVEAALLQLVEVRMLFLEKYFMMASRLEGADYLINDKTIAQVKQRFRQQEVSLLASMFERGAITGELKPLDPLKTAGLLLDTLSALAHCVREQRIPPDHKTVTEVGVKQKEVLQLFYNGLKEQA